ncbi:MAG: septum formation inhibitor Maf [Proteobacteria bacterium]|nr:septum formation inhibitor Maf [Pseudomonadota bacterium]
MRIYLASRSPRRRELLTQIGVRFDSLLFRDGARMDPEVDETPQPGEAADAYVERLARAKAEHGGRLVLLRHLIQQPVLAADTSIELDGEIIGKPDNDEHASAILQRLSGRAHFVLTGVAVHFGDRTEYVLSKSEVVFRTLEAEEIRRYVLSGEHCDKAGAYGIQGHAALFVEHLAGDYNGVMGLPLCKTGELLKRFGHKVL